jgi:serine/threonine protein kinase
MLQLELIGDPHSQPGGLKDLAAVIHDILHGLADLHKEGYTHRDIRW